MAKRASRQCSHRERVKRDTTETQIALKLVVDGQGKSTRRRQGIRFFDHMLELF